MYIILLVSDVHISRVPCARTACDEKDTDTGRWQEISWDNPDTEVGQAHGVTDLDIQEM